jgi:hypothetical protein
MNLLLRWVVGFVVLEWQPTAARARQRDAASGYGRVSTGGGAHWCGDWSLSGLCLRWEEGIEPRRAGYERVYIRVSGEDGTWSMCG